MKRNILGALLLLFCGCDNSSLVDVKIEPNATVETTHGLFYLGDTFMGGSLENVTYVDEPTCNEVVICAYEDGTAVIHKLCDHNTCDTATIRVTFKTDGKSVSVQNGDSVATYKFGKYHYYTPYIELDTDCYIIYTTFNTPKGKRMYKYNCIYEIRNDSTAKMWGNFKVPEDRVWQDKNIVGYFDDWKDYYHFRNDGTVTKKNRFGAEKTRKEGNYKLWHNGKNDRITMTFGETNETIEASVVFDEEFFLFYEDGVIDIDSGRNYRRFNRTKVNDEVK